MNLVKLAMSAVALAAMLLTAPLAYPDSDSWQFNENNNPVISAQSKSGDASKAGDVKIEFYGHMAFKITSPDGIRIMVDPWRNDPSGAWGLWFPKEFPAVPVDIVLSTHAHFDHDAVYRVHATMVLERMGPLRPTVLRQRRWGPGSRTCGNRLKLR